MQCDPRLSVRSCVYREWLLFGVLVWGRGAK